MQSERCEWQYLTAHPACQAPFSRLYFLAPSTSLFSSFSLFFSPRVFISWGEMSEASLLCSPFFWLLQSSSSCHVTILFATLHRPFWALLSATMLFHSIVLCVTHHGNKCVHSFEDCHHDRARLSNFPSRIVMPSNCPPPPPNAAVSAPVKEKSLEDGTINSIIVLGVAFAVSVLNVTPERQLQPPGQLREDAIWCLDAGRLGCSCDAVSWPWMPMTLRTLSVFFLGLRPRAHQCDQGYASLFQQWRLSHHVLSFFNMTVLLQRSLYCMSYKKM